MSTYTPTPVRLVSTTIPDDTISPRNASSLNVPVEALADDAAWMKDRFIQVYSFNSDDGEFPGAGSVALKVWSTSTYSDVTGAAVTVPDCEVGDVLLLDLTSHLRLTPGGAGDVGVVRFRVFEDAAGTPVDNSPTTKFVIADEPGAALHMTAHHVVANDGDVYVTLQGSLYTGTTMELLFGVVNRVVLLRKVSS